MRNNHPIVAFTAMLLAAAAPIQPTLAAGSLCEPQGYTVPFFNGVWCSFDDADDVAQLLADQLPPTVNGVPVSTELFYNHSGFKSGFPSAQDIAETFIQRANELDASGALSLRFEYFWPSIGFHDVLTSKIASVYPKADSIFSNIYTSIMSQLVSGFAKIISSPPTDADYAEHDARLDALVAEGEMLMLVAHSQGNLFLNHAYKHLVTSLGSKASFAAYHIAPASTELFGDYMLSDNDTFIDKLLRAVSPAAVPKSNIHISLTAGDPFGHMIVPVYLNSNLESQPKIITAIVNAMTYLTPPPTHGIAKGAFTATLTWSGLGDEDLHIIEPDGSHVYYDNLVGTVGQLDTDNTIGKGPEHYFASCDPSVLKTGTYAIGINNFYQADNQTATIEIALPVDGVVFSAQKNTGPTAGQAGNNSPVPVVNITVTKDPVTGKFSFKFDGK